MSFAPLNPFSLFNFMDCAPYAPSLLESTVFCTRPDMSFVVVACGLWGIWLFVTAYLEPAGLAVLWAVESVAHSLGWVESGAVAVVAPDIDI